MPPIVPTIIAILLPLMGFHSVFCSQKTDSKKVAVSDSIFDQSFYDAFDEMDKEDQLYDKLDEGYKNWEERCAAVGGEKTLDDWLEAQENLVMCFLRNFDANTILREVEEKKKTGDLELVFNKYCSGPVERTRPCIESFLKISGKCLRSKDRSGLNVTLKMIDAAIDFMCHDSGNRLALFMAENGLSCLQNHKEPIVNCINSTVPEIFHLNNHRNVNLIVFNQQNCRKGDAIRRCVEKELLKCPDPTSSNLMNSLLLAMKKATPCSKVYQSRLSGAISASLNYLAAMLPFLTIPHVGWLRI